MTSLLMILSSIAIALGFARYNNSNKLFWILLVSLLTGFTGAKMVSSTLSDHKSEASVKSINAPMLAPTCSMTALETEEGAGTIVETKPTGQDSVKIDTITMLSFGEEEYTKVLPKPPQEGLKTNFIFDTS